MRAKVYCEITCCNCGTLLAASRYYKNAKTISTLKEEANDWIWDEELVGNLCPSCQEELKNPTVEEAENSSVFDAWEATKQ